MNQPTISSPPSSAVDARIAFIGRTYGMLALCVASGSAGAWLAQGLAFPLQHPFLMLLIMIGGIFAVQAVRHTPGVNLIALLAFGAITGLSIAPLVGMVAARSGMLVVQAFLTAAVAFVALSGYCFASRRDFSFMRGFVIVGLIAVLVLGISNLFFQSPAFALAIAGMSVVLFSAFILYDTAQVLHHYPNEEYIAAALTLYLDLFLLFENLLLLFGGLGSDD
ncbi:MAG: Bax inhibitor-1/YccA family protein [Gammaproteobacteria bacterium]|nr:MAG: Bax inhibitor-1/YccA family protein [Gammaproteobacteria bacterium]